MVKYDPMERPVLQLVTSHPATDKKLFPRRAPPWTGDISQLSPAQLRSIHAFTQYAINNLRGVEGTVSFRGNRISESAMRVMEDYPHQGVGAFGGDPERRRQRRYNRAEASLDQIESVMNQRGVSRTGGARVRGEAQTDGGQDIEPEAER